MGKSTTLESVDNALRLLLLVAESDQVRVSDVAQELGIALSTAHRLLATMRVRGFVDQEPGHRAYVKGPAFARLGNGVRQPPQLADLALPHLRRLRDEVDETTHLSVPDGADMHFVVSVESAQVLRVGSRVGVRMPTHRTSGGKALLAALPPEALAERLSADGEASLRLDPGEVRRMRRELAGVRRSGYGLNRAESERGIAAVGVAIVDAAGTPVGALSISVPTVRLNPARVRDMAAALVRAKRALEQEL